MKRKILVVEDVEADALAAKDDLEEGNFEVDIARSANEGLGKLLLNQYALAIVDLQLSANGSFADGMDLIKKAKASNVATPFAIFSNMTDTNLLTSITIAVFIVMYICAIIFLQKGFLKPQTLFNLLNAIGININCIDFFKLSFFFLFFIL